MKRMLMLLLLLSVLPLVGQEDECSHEGPYTAEFNIEACDFYNRYPTYSNPNPYFILEPGWQLVLEGEEDGEIVHLEITVLDEVEWVDGVWTRVIEEREWVDEELVDEIIRDPLATAIPVTRRDMTIQSYLNQAKHVQNTLPFNATWAGEMNQQMTTAEIPEMVNEESEQVR